jgi:pimeloyl-ACP methyl ester carboxylesterase
MVLALRYPALVKALVVVDIAPVTTDTRHAGVVRALRNLKLAAVRSRRDAEAALSFDIPDSSLRRFLLQNLIRRETGYEWRINLQALDDNMTMLAGFPVLPGCYSGPTLFARGGDSNYVEIKHESVIRQMFPSSVIRTIAHAGHWLHAEKPREFLHELESFLAPVDKD